MSDGDDGTLGDASDGSAGKYVQNMFLAFGWRMRMVCVCQKNGLCKGGNLKLQMATMMETMSHGFKGINHWQLAQTLAFRMSIAM